MCFKCDFLSSIQQMSAKLKITVKINTIQNNQHFAFCSFTVLNPLKECLIAVWPDFQQVIIDTAVEQ